MCQFRAIKMGYLA